MEHLAELVLRSSAPVELPLRILDICSGSGSLALLLAHRLRSKASITGIDINSDAVALARQNAALNNLQDHVDFQTRNFLEMETLEPKVDIIVSNPPYIPRAEWDTLPASVKRHEDPRAFIGDPQDLPMSRQPSMDLAVGGISDGRGLHFYRRIATLLPVLRPQPDAEWDLPAVAVEIGADQATEVQQIFKAESGGLVKSTEVVKDQFGQDRMVIGLAK